MLPTMLPLLLTSLTLIANLPSTLASTSSPNLTPRSSYILKTPIALPNALVRRATCDSTDIDCGNLCVPSGYKCCSDGGAGCPIGNNCVPGGCCPIGQTCSGGGGTLTEPDFGDLTTTGVGTGGLSTATGSLSGGGDSGSGSSGSSSGGSSSGGSSSGAASGAEAVVGDRRGVLAALGLVVGLVVLRAL